MTTLLISTDSVDGFFARARNAARKADCGENFLEKMTITFEDPQQMFMVLSVARRRIMIEVMKKPQTIKDLVHNLNRNRSTIVRDIHFLERKGLLICQESSSECNAREKIIRSVAPRIELVAMLG
jgi:predicted transcriptional regulator